MSRIVGLDIGRLTVKAVAVEGVGRTWELVDVFEEAIEIPAPDAELGQDEATPASGTPAADAEADPGAALSLGAETLAALRRLADRGAFVGDGVVASMRGRDAVLTRISLPFEGAKEIRAVLAPQLEGRLPAEIEDFLVDFERGARLPNGEFAIFTAAVTPETVAIRLGELASVGVDPRALEVPPFHLVTLARNLLPANPAPVAIVDIGADTTSVVIVADGQLQTCRSFPGGGERATALLAESFGLTPELAREGKHSEGFIDPDAVEQDAPTGDDATDISNACRRGLVGIIRQLRRTLHAHAAEWGGQVGRVYLVGGGSVLSGTAEYVGASLGIETVPLPFDQPGLSRVEGFAAVAPRFASALAMALRGISPATASSISARQGAFAFRGSYDYLRAAAPQLAFGAATLAVLFVAFIGARLAALGAEVRALDATLESATQELFGSPETDPDRIRSELTLRAARPSFLMKESAYDLLVMVSNTIGETLDNGYSVAAGEVEVDMERKVFRVSGTADSAESVDTFQQFLAQQECFKELERTELAQRGEGFEFTLQGMAFCGRVVEER
ncbi:MAG: pilus assembly protein PilM [Myxococcales bacterium]|nr:pilus assembly protein PilM [Myxococcales bacterium]MCB9520051.1 pilus assembly protein PilM [Myxococcales bacterium]